MHESRRCFRADGALGRVALVLAILLGACSTASAQTDEIVMRSALVVEGVSRSGRTLIQTDAVEALRVKGEWKTPQAGDRVTLADGTTRDWAKKEAGDDAWISVRGGGYACWTFESATERVMILDAAGHGAAIVNNEPRAGDPYEYGYVRLPVLVKAGTNEILFRGGRGRVRAKLTPPKAEVMFNTGDVTLPDLVEGERGVLGSIVVINATTRALKDVRIRTRIEGQAGVDVMVHLPPLSIRKAPFSIPGSWQPHTPVEAREQEFIMALTGPDDFKTIFDEHRIKLNVRKHSEKHKRTFISEIDGSVQYYAVVPPAAGTDLAHPKALILSLHGASVEAMNQANCYKQRDWCYVVCPTNRRPYGFDWEDWGRTDALEVLAEAQRRFNLDRRRQYLTGHSMGGHGTWNIAAQFPGRFAAIGPSAGWISFSTYGGRNDRTGDSPIEQILKRAACTSDTLALKQNLASTGIYILHGDADDNVPVDQARTMRKELADHKDLMYHEQPGAGHWWGDQCVDWDPMIEFFQGHVLPEEMDVRRVEFTTVNPGVSGACHWLRVEQQIRQFEPSRVVIEFDAAKMKYSGTTENVAAMSLPNWSPRMTASLDGQELAITPERSSAGTVRRSVRLLKADGAWRVESETDADAKDPDQHGLFKTAFSSRVLLVYSTQGTAEENAWSAAKARYDAETFWYRGNASVGVASDLEFKKAREDEHVRIGPQPDDAMRRNVVLYGNADTNAAWDSVLGNSPLHIGRGVVRVGDREIRGDHLACLVIRPREKGRWGAWKPMVGVVGGTGLVGMRLTDRLPYFVSGVGVPDWVVLSPRLLTEGAPGVTGAGFFGNDWTLDAGEAAWSE